MTNNDQVTNNSYRWQAKPYLVTYLLTYLPSYLPIGCLFTYLPPCLLASCLLISFPPYLLAYLIPFLSLNPFLTLWLS